MKKPSIYVAAAVLAVGTAAGAYAAPHPASTTSSLHARIATLEARALAAHQTQLAASLHRMDVAMSYVSSQGKSGDQSCPPSSQNPGGNPACGKDHHGSTPPPPACGPADQGGSAATGPVSSQVYGIGEQISNNGGAPLGDAVQSIACAVSNLTGGQL